MSDNQPPCRVCGSEVRVRHIAGAPVQHQDRAVHDRRICTNQRCETNTGGGSDVGPLDI
ncbi:hypothetical protein [Nocardioides mangrovicus]|uniref:hypothetical protein n=1 Tax=Nocardioides mangrovicus TaxID=2478913 RepID=UPI0013149068|nr:hypothetical protein [Nocardioides mangrovicus]